MSIGETTQQFFTRRAVYVWRRLLKPRVVQLSGVWLSVDHPIVSQRMRNIIYSGNYEAPEARIAQRLIRSDDRVLEVGAGMGFVTTICCKLVSSHDQVMTVEANPLLQPLLAETFRRNNVSPLLMLGAVSTKGDKMALNIGCEFVSSSLKVRDEQTGVIEVPGISISNLLSRHKPTVLVMDIEGAEIDCLTGADLSNVRAICVEVHPHIVGHWEINKMVDALRCQGFEIDYTASGFGTVLFQRSSNSSEDKQLSAA